jgi:hypothetical protein
MQILIGIGASLAGVVVGAFLTRWLDASYEQRHQVRETVAAAMVLRDELFDSRMGFESMVDMNRFASSYLFAGLREWDAHRTLFLAAGMPHRDWNGLARIFRRVLEITESIKPFGGSELSPGWKSHLQGLAAECQQGEEILASYCVEVKKLPIRRPMSVFRSDE